MADYAVSSVHGGGFEAVKAKNLAMAKNKAVEFAVSWGVSVVLSCPDGSRYLYELARNQWLAAD